MFSIQALHWHGKRLVSVIIIEAALESVLITYSKTTLSNTVITINYEPKIFSDMNGMV